MQIEKLVVSGDAMPEGVNTLDKVVVLEKLRKVAIVTTKRSVQCSQKKQVQC